MIRTLWAEDDRQRRLIVAWVANQIWPGQGRDFGACQGLAVLDGNELIAGIIYHNYHPDAAVMELSSASIDKRWLTRPVLKAMFEYPFIECHCQAVVLRVADENKHMHRIAKAYGFEHYVIPRLRGRDANENVFVLTDDAWKSNRFNRGK